MPVFRGMGEGKVCQCSHCGRVLSLTGLMKVNAGGKVGLRRAWKDLAVSCLRALLSPCLPWPFLQP